MELLLATLRTLLLAYAAMLVYALLFANRIIFQPQPASYRDDGEIIKLTTADGVRISALHLPDESAQYTILYSHGNAEDLGDIRPSLEEFRRRGFAVFAYDYHGYGTSGGRPSERNAYRDIEAAYDYLTGVLGVAPGRIILHGYSVGSGPALELAVRRRVGGVVLESALTTAFRTVTRIPILPFDRFRNIDRVRTLRTPVLVIHGSKDRVIPFAHGKRLYEAAAGPKRALWVEGAGHYDLRDVAGERYWEALRDFTRLLSGLGQ